MIKKALRAAADSFGYTIERKPEHIPTPPAPPREPEKELSEFPADFTQEEIAIWKSVEAYTMTSKERVVSLVRAVRYLERYRIPGALVECGVWRGGSMMVVAKTLLALNSTSRQLFLFDTFSGMPDAAEVDVDVDGQSASSILAGIRNWPPERQAERNVLARCPLDVVRDNLLSTGYPTEKLHFVAGRVEMTLPAHAPDRVALLRLDTDWYESTRHELVHLFPRLSRHGVLIVDDYGHWRGARLAVDEFFDQNNDPVFLSRVDYTGRIAIRC